jgi:hypothetical protein
MDPAHRRGPRFLIMSRPYVKEKGHLNDNIYAFIFSYFQPLAESVAGLTRVAKINITTMTTAPEKNGQSGP